MENLDWHSAGLQPSMLLWQRLLYSTTYFEREIPAIPRVQWKERGQAGHNRPLYCSLGFSKRIKHLTYFAEYVDNSTPCIPLFDAAYEIKEIRENLHTSFQVSNLSISVLPFPLCLKGRFKERKLEEKAHRPVLFA